MMDSNQNNPEDFSLSEGGPFNRLLVKTGLHDNPSKLIIVSFCIAGLPPIIITALEGTLYSGVQIPFLEDYSMHGRILFAIPMLLLIRFVINRKVIEVVNYLSESLLSPEESKLLVETVFHRAKKLTNSTLAEIILLLLVIVATISIVKGEATIGFGKSSTWMISAKWRKPYTEYCWILGRFYFNTDFSISFHQMVVEVFSMGDAALQAVKSKTEPLTDSSGQMWWLRDSYTCTKKF